MHIQNCWRTVQMEPNIIVICFKLHTAVSSVRRSKPCIVLSCLDPKPQSIKAMVSIHCTDDDQIASISCIQSGINGCIILDSICIIQKCFWMWIWPIGHKEMISMASPIVLKWGMILRVLGYVKEWDVNNLIVGDFIGNQQRKNRGLSHGGQQWQPI